MAAEDRRRYPRRMIRFGQPNKSKQDAFMARERSYEEPKTIEIAMNALIREGFPQIEHTTIPDTICMLLKTIEPLCQKGAMYEAQYDEQSKDAYLGLRGSLPKRKLLKGTPEHYWEISPKYKDTYMRTPHPTPESTNRQRLKSKTLEKLVFGPLDLDIVYKLSERTKNAIGEKEGHLAIFAFIGRALTSIDYQASDLKVTPEAGGKKMAYDIQYKKNDEIIELKHYQKGDPDLGEMLNFTQVRFYRKGHFVFKVDIVNLPENKDLDFRFGPYMPGFDLLPRAWIKRSDKGSVRVSIPKELARISGLKKTQSQFVLNEVFSRLRGLGNASFWPTRLNRISLFDRDLLTTYQKLYVNGYFKKPIDKYRDWLDMNVMLNKLRIYGYSRSKLDIFTGWEDKVNEKILRERLPDITSEFMTYLSYDPFLFLRLAYEGGLFHVIPFGNDINRESLNQITIEMVREMEEKYVPEMAEKDLLSEIVLRDPVGNTFLASKMYKEVVLGNPNSKMEDLGPFIFARAFLKYMKQHRMAIFSEIHSAEDVDLDFVLDMLNPLYRKDSPDARTDIADWDTRNVHFTNVNPDEPVIYDRNGNLLNPLDENADDWRSTTNS